MATKKLAKGKAVALPPKPVIDPYACDGERFTILIIRAVPPENNEAGMQRPGGSYMSWHGSHVDERVANQLLNAPLQGWAHINGSFTRQGEPDENDEIRRALSQIRDCYPPLPLPKLDCDDPAAVQAWCREPLQKLRAALEEAERRIGIFGTAEDDTEAIKADPEACVTSYAMQASNALVDLVDLATDARDTLWSVGLEEDLADEQ